MILLTLVGTFMVFTGIILHVMSKLINENTKKINRLPNPDLDVGLKVT
jgi:hypothetical protein